MTHYTSRFIIAGDLSDAEVVYPLPASWWSRGHEYAWAERFAGPGHIVLDAACGVCHPLKFRLAELAAEAHACDSDPRVTDYDAIVADIAASAGPGTAAQFDRARLDQLQLTSCDITRMPYADAAFDRVFCISVFEHLAEGDQLRSLMEFTRVLTDDGLIVMTVDYPTVDLERLTGHMTASKLTFAGPHDFAVPPDAISSSMWGPELRCVRLLLQKDAAA